MTAFGTIEQAIDDLRNGKIVIVADDEDRENEGDLVCAAELVTPEMINFMTLHGRGLICLALTGERCDQLGLPQMTERNTEELSHRVHGQHRRRAPVRRDHRHLRQRPRDDDPRRHRSRPRVPSDLRRPGHIFPLRARPGGVLQRVGQTEASVDLARLAGLVPAGVICEILNADGSMARRPELQEIARQHGLTFVTVAQLVAYRLQTERLVHRVAEARLPTEFGEFTDHRLPERRGPRRARGAGLRRRGGPAQRAGADALEVPHRRRLPLAALRLRLAAAAARWS